jgi:hypothetical protein
VRRTVPPSAEIEEPIDQRPAVGVGENPRTPKTPGSPVVQHRAFEAEIPGVERSETDRRTCEGNENMSHLSAPSCSERSTRRRSPSG